RQPVGRGECQFQRPRISDPGALEIRSLHALRAGQGANLLGRTVDQDYPDVEGPQEGDVEQEGGEVLVADNAGVDGENEGLLTELRHILENPAQISQLHWKHPGSRLHAWCDATLQAL